MTRRKYPWFALLILVLAILVVGGGCGISLAHCQKAPAGSLGECPKPAIECEYPDTPVCWCSEVTGTCKWYCHADPIGGIE